MVTDEEQRAIEHLRHLARAAAPVWGRNEQAAALEHAAWQYHLPLTRLQALWRHRVAANHPRNAWLSGLWKSVEATYTREGVVRVRAGRHTVYVAFQLAFDCDDIRLPEVAEEQATELGLRELERLANEEIDRELRSERFDYRWMDRLPRAISVDGGWASDWDEEDDDWNRRAYH